MRSENTLAVPWSIDSIASRLTDDENAFRMLLIEQTVERGGPVNVENLPHRLQHRDAPKLIEGIVAKRAAVKDRDGNLNFIYPVSALPTRHEVLLDDGRAFHAMCAVDSMGAAFTFRRNVRVRSSCRACDEPIRVGIENGRLALTVPHSMRILHVDLTKYDDWAGSV